MRFTIRAKNDDPPSVDFEIWIDESKVGDVSFPKGDQSWEELSTYALVDPNMHWLRIWFVNDYLDAAAGDDRNAYVEWVEMTKVEAAYCESN
jgi:hypothetical protein